MGRAAGSRSTSGLLLRLLLLLIPCFNVSLFQVTGQEASNPAYHADQFIYPNNGAWSYRNNFCDLINANRSNVELENSLLGFEIRVALMEGSLTKFDYTYDEDGTVLSQKLSEPYPGPVPKLLDELCERSGCTWRNSYYTHSNDLPDDKTFTDYILWLTDVYDLAADWFMPSMDRLNKGVTLTYGWYDASIIMVGKDEGVTIEVEDKLDYVGWLRPFTGLVWYAIIASILISAVVYVALVRIDPNSDIPEQELTYSEAIWMFATAVTGQFEFAPTTNASRLFTFSIAFWALLVISAYTANLAAFLVKRNQTLTLEIETIDQAMNNGRKMCVWKGTQTDSSIMNEYPAFTAGKDYIRTIKQADAYIKVLSGECDIVITEQSSWDQFQRNQLINGNCTLRQIGDIWQRKDASFVLKGDSGQYCTSYLRDVFDYYFIQMEADGTLEDLWNEAVEYVSTVNCDAGLGSVVRHLGENQNFLPQMNNDVDRKKNRVLKSIAAKSAGSESGALVSNESGDSNSDQLNMINMGGVFILHFTLMAVSFIIAFFAVGLP